MASTSSVGTASLASASSAAAFYTHFSDATDALRTQVADASNPATLQAALQRLAALNAELTAAVDSGVLPAHDQGLHKRTLDGITRSLDQRRRAIEPAKATSGGGFAFRRKPAKPAPTKPQPTTSTESTRVASAPDAAAANHLTISSLSNTCYIPPPQEALRLSVHVSDVTDSVVDLRSLSATVVSVQLRGIADSMLLLPSIEGSVMAHDISHSLVSIPSCHQFRMHTSSAVAVQLTTKRASVVTIEACRKLVFIADEASLKVQDFDDLIGSHQLASSTPHDAAPSCNFRIVQAHTSMDALDATPGIAARIDDVLATLGG